MGSQLRKLLQFRTVRAVKVQTDPYNEEYYTSVKAPVQTEYDKQNSEYRSTYGNDSSQLRAAEMSDTANSQNGSRA